MSKWQVNITWIARCRVINSSTMASILFFFFQAEDGIRDLTVTGVQTCALPICTQREIAQETKLGKDEIGDALANLLLWTHEIRTQVVGNTRLYFLNEPDEAATLDDSPRLPARKQDVPSSFSCLQGLMPGRNPEGEPAKIGGWVAA